MKSYIGCFLLACFYGGLLLALLRWADLATTEFGLAVSGIFTLGLFIFFVRVGREDE